MSDERIQELERRLTLGNDPADAVRYLSEALRVGRTTVERVQVAGFLGDEAARAVVGPPPPAKPVHHVLSDLNHTLGPGAELFVESLEAETPGAVIRVLSSGEIRVEVLGAGFLLDGKVVARGAIVTPRPGARLEVDARRFLFERIEGGSLLERRATLLRWMAHGLTTHEALHAYHLADTLRAHFGREPLQRIAVAVARALLPSFPSEVVGPAREGIHLAERRLAGDRAPRDDERRLWSVLESWRALVPEPPGQWTIQAADATRYLLGETGNAGEPLLVVLRTSGGSVLDAWDRMVALVSEALLPWAYGRLSASRSQPPGAPA